jgi:hypothetical protein
MCGDYIVTAAGGFLAGCVRPPAGGERFMSETMGFGVKSRFADLQVTAAIQLYGRWRRCLGKSAIGESAAVWQERSRCQFLCLPRSNSLFVSCALTVDLIDYFLQSDLAVPFVGSTLLDRHLGVLA